MGEKGLFRPRAEKALLTAALALLASCAAGPPVFKARPERRITWPENPTGPWIEFLLAYGGTRDVERSPGFWEGLSNLLAGSREIRLVSPAGLALDGKENLYVADPGLRALHKISLRTGRHQVFTGSGNRTFLSPVGVAVGPEGTLFLTDSAARRIYRLSPAGEVTGLVGEGVEIGRPTGIVWDRRGGRLLVADTTKGRILAFRADGTLLGSYGRRGGRPGEFNYPTALAVSSRGLVLVSDSMNFRIQVLSPDMKPLRTFGIPGRGPGNFACPKGVALDSEDHVYVVDGMFDNVQIFDLEGRLLLVFGARGAGLGRFYLPSGIFIDRRDRIFVADGGNSRVQVFQFHEVRK